MPGVEGVDYTWPTTAELDHFAKRGMNTVRLSFTWERLQPTARGELEATYLDRLDGLVAHATERGLEVVLDPHNFARYYGTAIGGEEVPTEVFADLWSRLATRYGANARVSFGLMNEPHDLPTEQWVAAANGAIAAIRQAGATNRVLVPGNGWSGAYSWASGDYGTPNAVALLAVEDPGDNVVFEAHQYLDTDAGGERATCVSKTIGSARLVPFVEWLRTHGKRGIIAELGAGHDATCDAAIDDMLTAIEAASDVLLGWVWWAAGPAWGTYPLSLEPKGDVDAPEMTVLLPHLGRGS